MTSAKSPTSRSPTATPTRASGWRGIADLLWRPPDPHRTDDSVVRSLSERAGAAECGARAGTCRRARPASLAAAAGLRRRAQEHLCVAKGRAPGPAPHRRPQELGDAALVSRGGRALRAPVRGRARGGGARPAPRVPVDEVRARARGRRARRRPAPPRPPRGVPGRARRDRARRSGRSTTAPATAPTARSGAASCSWATCAGSSARATWPVRLPGGDAPCRSRGGWPAPGSGPVRRRCPASSRSAGRRSRRSAGAAPRRRHHDAWAGSSTRFGAVRAAHRGDLRGPGCGGAGGARHRAARRGRGRLPRPRRPLAHRRRGRDLNSGIEVETVAARFHAGVARTCAAAAPWPPRAVRHRVLSGGVFQYRRCSPRRPRCSRPGLRVLIPSACRRTTAASPTARRRWRRRSTT